jgi:histidyl-tRNA synthetase
VEAIGQADAAIDAELIELAWRIFAAAGLRDLTLLLNSIGDPACRPDYLKALRAYYEPFLDRVCADCKRRHQANPLRLLDCKKESCQPLTAEAPKAVDHLCAPCQEHWDDLRRALESLGLAFQVEHRLVRGLDYYTRTVFEIAPPTEGAQSTLGGGGRYDGLIEQLGGPPTPGAGFALGIERILLNMRRQGAGLPAAKALDAIVACVGEGTKAAALKLASDLRSAGLSAVLAPGGKSLKAQLRYAGSVGAAYVLILGDDELRQGIVTVKAMADGSQRTVPLAEAAKALPRP